VAEGGGAATSATAATSPSSGSDSGIPLPPVVIDGDGNLLLDTPQMQTSADDAGCSRTRPFEKVPGSPGSYEAGDVAEERDSAVSPSIEMWLGRKEEARAGRAVATAAAAATRESVALPRGPRTPLEDAFCTAGSARIEEAQEYDAVVRETASLAIELDRVAEAEAREAAEDEEDRLAEEAAAPRGPTGMKGGFGPRRNTHRNRSGNRGACMSDSGDSSDEDGITPLPYGAAIASPPSVRTGSAARNDSGERAEVPLSPQASDATRVAAISPWPWWMVMLGCDGCATVRPNKQHKYTFEDEQAEDDAARLGGGLDGGIVGALFGAPTGPITLPPPSTPGNVNFLD